MTGSLVFSSPDQPLAVQQPDAGLVELDFGQVIVGSTATLTLSSQSLTGSVSLGDLTTLQPDTEFALPFVPGTVIATSPPQQITVSFGPTSLGAKAALFQLAYSAPAAETVLFRLTGQGVANGLTVDPNPVDFGQVEINQTQLVALTITNGGQSAASLVVTPPQGPNGSLFTVASPASATLAPGASTTLNVGFGPLASGPASASFTIDGWTTSPPVTVELHGTGVTSWLSATSPLDFGFVQVGSSFTKAAMVTNLSAYTTLHVVAPTPIIEQRGAGRGAEPYSLNPPTPILPLALSPGQSLALPITFTPPSLDQFGGSLLLTTDDPLGPQLVIVLSGYGGGPEISCLPDLAFGPVPVGLSVTQIELCLNAGQTIPSHPDLTLQISQSALSVTNPAFVANLKLPDGGLAGPGGGVSLAAGQSAAIQVTFLPEDAGVYFGRLSVPSNDVDDIDAGVLLSGEGIVPGPCSLQVVPSQVAFGEVPKGSSGVLQFEVSNVGQDYCEINHVRIDPSSDPAFSLRNGDPGYRLLSFPGNTDNPTNLPTVSPGISVQFAPTASENAAIGKVDVASANAVPSTEVVSLTAVSLPACLSLDPPDHDFGVVGFSPSKDQLCEAPLGQTFTASNACSQPVNLTALAINSGLDTAAQFSLQSSLTLPLTIAPGDQVTFQAIFAPATEGPKVGAITATSSEFPATPYLISLEGDAESTGTRTDTFIVPVKKVDVLWVVDNDDDDYSETISVLPKLFTAMNADHLDYQMAVTDTDVCDAGRSDQGFLEPCDHCHDDTSSNGLIITAEIAGGPYNALGHLLGDMAVVRVSNPTDPGDPGFYWTTTSCAGWGSLIPWGLGPYGNVTGDEHFFDALADALSPPLLAAHNAGFVRPDAYLAVILLNDDSEDDAFGGTPLPSQIYGPGGFYPPGPYLTSVQDAADIVQGLKTDPSMASVSAISIGGMVEKATPRISALVSLTGGIYVDQLLPDAVWESGFLNIFGSTIDLGVFRLTSPVVAPDQIRVQLNGVAVSGNDYNYDPIRNAIVFPQGQIPLPGSTITVTYPLGCP